jgi:hypothetical protein
MEPFCQSEVYSNDIETTYPLNTYPHPDCSQDRQTKKVIVLPNCLKEKILSHNYKTKFSNEVMKELRDNYYTPIPYLDMGYVVRHCSDTGNMLYGNILYQYVQNYLNFLYGYKDYTDEFTEIIVSIKNTYKSVYSSSPFKYEELMDDYRYPGSHSGGSFAICRTTLYYLIDINTKKISKKDKLSEWNKFCVINKFHINL